MSVDRDCLLCGERTYEVSMTGGCSHLVILKCWVCGFWKSKRTKQMVYGMPSYNGMYKEVPRGLLLILKNGEVNIPQND